jgi:putative endopeptidase
MIKIQLLEMTPDFDWSRYFRGIGLPEIGKVNVGQPDFFKAADKLLTNTPVDEWKTYLRWHLVNAASSTLSSKFVLESFNFNGKYLQGTTEMLPRWKRCVASTDRALGEALGKLYVAKTFTPAAKNRARMMVANLIAALRDDLATLSWMSQETRQKAIGKLEAYVRKIGYPDKWRDYEALQITRGAYYNNAVSAGEFDFKRNLVKIGKPVDRTEWGMSPPTVNAYYNPQFNEIVFPAGILQPPFYDPKADDAFNYGGIGAVIGHEMTHGFDDQGSQYDGKGNLREWQTPADRKAFTERTDCEVTEYGNFEPVPGAKLNGKLTLGENTADNGGIRIAYLALMNTLEQEGKKADAKDASMGDFTPAQQFFITFGQVWCENRTEQASRLSVKTDPHSPGKFRTNGTVQNFDEFGKAFGCKKGSPMYPENSCRVW